MRKRFICFSVCALTLFGIVPRCPAPPLPGATVTQLEWARRLIDGGVLFEAADVLTDYLRGNENNIGARYYLALLLFQLESYSASAEQALMIPASDPLYGRSRQHLLMRLRMRVGRDLDWNDSGAVLAFARLCSRMGSYERSVRAYRRLLERDTTPAVRREYAVVLGWSGDARGAAREWLRYLEVEPGDLDARHQLARAYMAIGRLDDAARNLESVLARQPEATAVMLDLARVQIWQGEMMAADKILADLLNRNHEPAEAGLLRAELLLRMGNVEEAYRTLQTALKHAPNESRVQQRLQELEVSRRVDIARLRRRIDQAPDEEVDRRRLIDIFLDIQRPGAALREMKALAAVRPEDSVQAERIAMLETQYKSDVARLLKRLAKTTSMEHLQSKLAEWTMRHPEDERAIQRREQTFPPSHRIHRGAPWVEN